MKSLSPQVTFTQPDSTHWTRAQCALSSAPALVPPPPLGDVDISDVKVSSDVDIIKIEMSVEEEDGRSEVSQAESRSNEQMLEDDAAGRKVSLLPFDSSSY